MQFTKPTIRALAASVALVAAGGTVAGAAVFHLPILGFASPAASAASNLPAATAKDVAAIHVAPRRVVKTRVVTDIVHGHRPGYASAAGGYAPMPSAVTVASTSAPTTPPPTAAPPSTPPPTAAPPMTEPEDGHDGHDHEGGGDREGAPTTTTTTLPGQ